MKILVFCIIFLLYFCVFICGMWQQVMMIYPNKMNLYFSIISNWILNAYRSLWLWLQQFKRRFLWRWELVSDFWMEVLRCDGVACKISVWCVLRIISCLSWEAFDQRNCFSYFCSLYMKSCSVCKWVARMHIVQP